MVKRLFPLLGIVMATPAWAGSYYTTRLEDAKAVYLTAESFGVRGDGAADDTAAIQKAIDKTMESGSYGIVFVPEGRYRLTKAVTVWASVRLVGYGAKRPVFLLAAQTTGYQDPMPREHNCLAGRATDAGCGRRRKYKIDA